MKKLNTTKLLVLLLALCLVTSSFVGGTLAKYVTTGSASDTARVAKWGVALQVDGNLFGKYYLTGNESIPTTTTDVSKLSVAINSQNASDEDDLVAPGTKSENGLTVSLNGTPEVRAKIEMNITAQDIFLAAGEYAQMIKATVNDTSFSNGTYYTYDAEQQTYTKAESYDSKTEYYTAQNSVTVDTLYNPVVYGDTDNSGVTAVKIAEAWAKKVNTNATAETPADNDTSVTYKVEKTVDPNTNLSNEFGLADDTVTWAWAFENQNDNADTILGLLKSDAKVVKKTDETYGELTEFTDYCLDTAFDISITVTQVD